MLKFFDWIKYPVALVLRRAYKIHHARRRIPGLLIRAALGPINAILAILPVLLSIFRRAVIFSSRGLPSGLRLVMYYITVPFFMNAMQTRMYLRPGWRLENFFLRLKEKNIRYVILRWFDDLPAITVGEDIDILIDDLDLKDLAEFLTTFPSGQAFDIYSLTGIENTTFNSLPYYPPDIAGKILDSRIWLKGIYAIPDDRHYFLSLAYHAVYHKGRSSGLKNGNETLIGTPDHNYAAILQDLSIKTGIQVDLSLLGLHELLQQNGWAPNVDMLRKLSQKNDWIADFLQDIAAPHGNDDEGEFMVFVLREWLIQNNMLDFTLEKLKEKNLDILSVWVLNDQEKEKAKRSLRGGKWDKGPYPISGGDPACLVACFDYQPRPVKENQKRSHPFVRNQNVFIKNLIRDEINSGRLWFGWVNCIHTADDEFEAWDYIRQVSPQREVELGREVRQRREAYCTDFPVIKRFISNNTRAKIELIDYHGQKAVKKTFKPGFEKFCEREVFACQYLGSKVDTIPEMFESGPNYLITRWYENILEDVSDLKRYSLIAPYGQKIVDTMRAFFQEGYALIGFYPGNVILTPNGEIKIIDFEFLYKYPAPPRSFMEAYEIAGLPKDFDGDLPRDMTRGEKGYTYTNTWRFVLGPLKKYLSP